MINQWMTDFKYGSKIRNMPSTITQPLCKIRIILNYLLMLKVLVFDAKNHRRFHCPYRWIQSCQFCRWYFANLNKVFKVRKAFHLRNREWKLEILPFEPFDVEDFGAIPSSSSSLSQIANLCPFFFGILMSSLSSLSLSMAIISTFFFFGILKFLMRVCNANSKNANKVSTKIVDQNAEHNLVTKIVPLP